MKTITVLTPVYNRREELNNLFLSLQKQTSNDFEWLIVDDGSTDGVKEDIVTYEKKAEFPVKVIHKENGGKHTALNRGIEGINTELTFIVDSDDRLTKDAIKTIKEVNEQYYNNAICGYSFLRQFPDGEINGKQFPKDYLVESYINVRINNDDLFADKAEVFFTKCLKEFPFPEFEGEKFLGEDVVWIRMARKYNMIHINRPIYIGNYLESGLTVNRRKNNISSPLGCMCRAKEFMEKDILFKYRLKGAIQYIVYGKFASNNLLSLVKKGKYKLLIIVSIIPGVILYRKWK